MLVKWWNHYSLDLCSYLTQTHSISDAFTVAQCCYQAHVRQRNENWASKMDREKFWVNGITFLSAPFPPISLCHFFRLPPHPSRVTYFLNGSYENLPYALMLIWNGNDIFFKSIKKEATGDYCKKLTSKFWFLFYTRFYISSFSKNQNRNFSGLKYK